MATTATILAHLNALLTGPAGGLGVASVRHPLEKDFTITDGAGLNQISKIWSKKAQSLAASTSETWDLSGALTDALGNVMIMTKLKAVMVVAALANVNDVVLGNDAAHVVIFGANTHSVAIKPGQAFLLTNFTAAGWVVTATTADLIKITNGGAGTPVVYDIALLGA
jgi:hypothetical protein